MASWSAYVTNLETGKARCKYAAICGKTGGVWAETVEKSAFPASPEEINFATKAILNQDQSVMGTGLKIGGQKFTCLRMEPDLLICQGKGDNKDFSLVFAISHQAVLVGFNPEADVKTQYVRDAIEVMRDYLKTNGY